VNGESSKTTAIRGFFIAGTDTGVGKTVVSVALTRALVARGKKVAVMKPVAAGAIDTPDGPRNDDALELLAASNVPANYDDVNPCLLATPASPHLAARHAGISIRSEPILRSQARLAAESELLIVEGAGGWLAPISALETMGDLAEKLGLPVILVVGLRLGCLKPSARRDCPSQAGSPTRCTRKCRWRRRISTPWPPASGWARWPRSPQGFPGLRASCRPGRPKSPKGS
jgi:dethiobiotin synthase